MAVHFITKGHFAVRARGEGRKTKDEVQTGYSLCTCSASEKRTPSPSRQSVDARTFESKQRTSVFFGECSLARLLWLEYRRAKERVDVEEMNTRQQLRDQHQQEVYNHEESLARGCSKRRTRTIHNGDYGSRWG
jgi:hypothetical protein